MLSVSDPVPFPAPPAAFNMAAHVLAQAERLADKPALEIVGPNTTIWTYAQIAAAVRGTATGLRKLGLSEGDHLLLQLGNTAEFPITYLGAIAAGIIPVPVSSQLTVPEITAIAATIRPALTIRAAGMAEAPGRVVSADLLTDFHSLPPADFTVGDPNRPAYVIYTSGTSGKPRPVVHAHRAIWARQMMWDGWYGLRETDRLLHAGAFNWTYTLGTGLMDPCSVGATALIPASGTEAHQLPQLLADHGATIFAAAPGVYRRMLRAGFPPCPPCVMGFPQGKNWPRITARPGRRRPAPRFTRHSACRNVPPSSLAAPRALPRPDHQGTRSRAAVRRCWAQTARCHVAPPAPSPFTAATPV